MNLVLHVPAMRVAKVTLLVPPSFQIPIDRPVGKEVGFASGVQGPLLTPGEIVVADPAVYVASAQAEACAPGAHDAVWTFELTSLGSKTMTVPMFIDHLASPNDQNSEYEIQSCPPQPQTSKLQIDGLEFDLEWVTNPALHGAYSWRALVVPTSATGVPDALATYEVRSVEGIPSRLTLSGSYDRAHHQALLSARFVAPDLDVQGLPVSLYVLVPDEHVFPYRLLTWSRTNAYGVANFRRHTRATRKYAVRLEAIGDCSSTPMPLAPCKNQTWAHLASAFVRVRAK